MTVPVVAATDTHALIWASTGRLSKLGRRARAIFEGADEGRATVFVPSMVLVETSDHAWRGRVRLGRSFSSWVNDMFRRDTYVPADLTPEVVLRAEALYAIPERADRLIAATAAVLDCPLITRDSEILAAAGVETVW